MTSYEKAPEQSSRSSSPDLEPLLIAAQRGDARALAEIYERFRAAVHGIVLARAGLEHAEDLTQDAFVAICRGLAQVRTPDALAGWICTVARNTAADHLRRRMRLPATEAYDETRVAGPPGDDSW